MKAARLFGLLSVFIASTLHAGTFNYNFTGINATIPDSDPSGYANTQTISGMSQDIASVTVDLNISGGYNGDLYGYLTLNGTTGFAVLLNRVGVTSGNAFGYGNTGFNVTIAGTGSDIHNYQSGAYTLNGSGQLTGTWAQDGRSDDPSVVTDASTRDALLSSFNGLDGNGTWTLALFDNSTGGESTLVSWGLTITEVPEPINWALGIFGAVALGGAGIRHWRKTVVSS